MKYSSTSHFRRLSVKAPADPVDLDGLPLAKHTIVIWEEVNDDPRMIYPVTAYEVPPPRN
jgi:hypothetical protein